jgi:molybdopterin synthase catalytic subunit
LTAVDVEFAITTEVLDPTRSIAAVADPGSGGLSIFAGAVRDDAGGKPVIGLHYEAHPSAYEVLADVCRRAAAMPAVRRICAVHRVGELGVGDLAVVVAVSAPHRDEAFAACRWLIDTLKAEVPIWKQERYADGGAEWVGCP